MGRARIQNLVVSSQNKTGISISTSFLLNTKFYILNSLLISLCTICLFCPVSFAAVDLYLAPTQAAAIQGNYVTYDMYIQSDIDTKLEAIGDVFLAYDRARLRIVTGNVVDRATQVRWTDRILDLNYTGSLYGVSENTGVIRFAKISLHEKMYITANVPVRILSIPFEIIPTPAFTMTRLYFPRAMMIDATHKNVLRNAADSFLIRQQSVVPAVQKRKRR